MYSGPSGPECQTECCAMMTLYSRVVRRCGATPPTRYPHEALLAHLGLAFRRGATNSSSAAKSASVKSISKPNPRYVFRCADGKKETAAEAAFLVAAVHELLVATRAHHCPGRGRAIGTSSAPGWSTKEHFGSVTNSSARGDGHRHTAVCASRDASKAHCLDISEARNGLPSLALVLG
jgi:hypothetical protein